jgi:hypothetical protein
MIQPDGSWNLGFTHQSWQLQRGQAFPIDLTFDGQAQFHVFGTPISANTVTVPMPNTSTLIADFRKSKAMTAFAQGRLFNFNLDGTSQLFASLANCVAIVNRGGLNAAGDFTVAKTVTSAPPNPTSPPTPAPPAVGTSLAPNTQQSDSLELRLEATELASNFVVNGLLHHPKVLTRAETPVALASYGAVWRSDEATGFVRIIPPADGMKGLDVAAAVVANDAKECKGKFASGRTTELVDSDVVFRGLSSCEDSEGPRLAYYFIVPRKKGGFVMFSVNSNMKTEEARSVTKDDKLAGLQKAALVTVGD